MTSDTDRTERTGAETTSGADRVGPELSLETVSLPPAIGERFQTLYGRERRPETAADWLDATAAALSGDESDSDGSVTRPTVDDLCTTDDGAHSFEGTDGNSQEYVCVLDPLAYPFLTGEAGTIRSTTPVRGTEIEFEVDADGVDLSHPDAVISLGVSDHVEAVSAVTTETIYRQVCGYIHVFEDRGEYET